MAGGPSSLHCTFSRTRMATTKHRTNGEHPVSSLGCRIVLKDGELTGFSRSDLRETMEAIRSSVATPTIAIHFHGGLVDQEKARHATELLAPEYAASGAIPIFVIWQTGLLETLKNNWKDIFSKEFFEGKARQEDVTSWTLKPLSCTRIATTSDVIADCLRRISRMPSAITSNCGFRKNEPSCKHCNPAKRIDSRTSSLPHAEQTNRSSKSNASNDSRRNRSAGPERPSAHLTEGNFLRAGQANDPRMSRGQAEVLNGINSSPHPEAVA